jgi:nicotinamide-nucleotide amidase
MPIAEIITIGTELLLGETADTNTRYLARALRELGVDLYRTQTIGDNAGRISRAVVEALQRADIVLTTGGLGPTVDDPTRQAIADATGKKLEFRPELWEQIVARIARYGRTPTGNQKRQAYVPSGALVIENPVGTAPAFIVEIPSPSSQLSSSSPVVKGNNPGGEHDTIVKVVITLPGVPREMETLLIHTVIPYLQKRFALHEIIKVRTLHVSGIGEGVLDDQVGDLEMLTNPTVGLTAHSGVVDVRIAAKASTSAEAESMIAKVEQDIRERLGEAIFGADDDTLEKSVLDLITRLGWTLTTLESGLGDALMKRLDPLHHPAYRGGKSHEIRTGELIKTSKALLNEMDASIVLGVALFISEEQQDVTISIITPHRQEERQLSYGGHPENASRWAVNHALDGLRRMLVREVK